MEIMGVLKGDLYYADLSPVVGCEQGGIRPVLIIQNDVGNRYSPTIIVAAITGRMTKNPLPTHICINGESTGLRSNSVILLEQIRTIDRCRLKKYIGCLDKTTMERVDHGIAVSLGIQNDVLEMIPELQYALV